MISASAAYTYRNMELKYLAVGDLVEVPNIRKGQYCHIVEQVSHPYPNLGLRMFKVRYPDGFIEKVSETLIRLVVVATSSEH